jgi:hypothetical protein
MSPDNLFVVIALPILAVMYSWYLWFLLGD